MADVTDGGDKRSEEPAPSFDHMGLHMNLLRGVYAHGFEVPTPIQQHVIVAMGRGGDLLVQSSPGTGKTGAYGIGLLQRCNFLARRKTQALVLAPSRELAQQIQNVIGSLGEYLGAGDFCGVFVGGTRVTEDVKKLRRGVIVAVGTPGRIGDLIKRSALHTAALKVVVLDEATDLLSEAAAEQTYAVFSFLPRDVDAVLVAAHIPRDVIDLSTRFMRRPTCYLLERDPKILEGIKQYYVAVEEEHKMETLVDLHEALICSPSVVFAATRRMVDHIAEQLQKRSTASVACLHSDMSQGERERALARFRTAAARTILVTTGTRGIDMTQARIVVSYDLPPDPAAYERRLACSGSSAKQRVAIALVAQRDVAALRRAETHCGVACEELPLDFMKDLES